jgi:hypothetical protein
MQHLSNIRLGHIVRHMGVADTRAAVIFVMTNIVKSDNSDLLSVLILVKH